MSTITNVAFGVPASPFVGETALVIAQDGDAPVIAQDGGAPAIWNIVPIPGSGCYHISAENRQAVELDSFIFIANRTQKWKIINQGAGDIFHIVKCDDMERGWRLGHGDPGAPVQCVPLFPDPDDNMLWRIEPPPPPPALQD